MLEGKKRQRSVYLGLVLEFFAKFKRPAPVNGVFHFDPTNLELVDVDVEEESSDDDEEDQEEEEEDEESSDDEVLGTVQQHGTGGVKSMNVDEIDDDDCETTEVSIPSKLKKAAVAIQESDDSDSDKDEDLIPKKQDVIIKKKVGDIKKKKAAKESSPPPYSSKKRASSPSSSTSSGSTAISNNSKEDHKKLDHGDKKVEKEDSQTDPVLKRLKSLESSVELILDVVMRIEAQQRVMLNSNSKRKRNDGDDVVVETIGGNGGATSEKKFVRKGIDVGQNLRKPGVPGDLLENSTMADYALFYHTHLSDFLNAFFVAETSNSRNILSSSPFHSVSNLIETIDKMTNILRNISTEVLPTETYKEGWLKLRQAVSQPDVQPVGTKALLNTIRTVMGLATHIPSETDVDRVVKDAVEIERGKGKAGGNGAGLNQPAGPATPAQTQAPRRNNSPNVGPMKRQRMESSGHEKGANVIPLVRSAAAPTNNFSQQRSKSMTGLRQQQQHLHAIPVMMQNSMVGVGVGVGMQMGVACGHCGHPSPGHSHHFQT
ncbi:hypothetical protein HDU76_009052, partial [Blyttiomyces sp. JEL0837]